MADLRDIVNAYAKPEPCRPFTVRVLSHGQILVRVALELGVRVNGSRYLTDLKGFDCRVTPGFVRKLATYANHSAYAGWIAATIADPLEVWEHPDPRSADPSPRRHYLGAYVGPTGTTTHLVIAVSGNRLINVRFKVPQLPIISASADCCTLGTPKSIRRYKWPRGPRFQMPPCRSNLSRRSSQDPRPLRAANPLWARGGLRSRSGFATGGILLALDGLTQGQSYLTWLQSQYSWRESQWLWHVDQGRPAAHIKLSPA